jgi:N6-L-threonylcarbamoyladenine synthase
MLITSMITHDKVHTHNDILFPIFATVFKRCKLTILVNYNYILSIETSCDETAAGVIHQGKILANVIAAQEIHSKYGGVIPELASRNHDAYMISVVKEALLQSGIQLADLDAIAVTQGPGLLGALLVGNTFAKSLAWSLGIPVIGVHHLQAHIAALYINNPHPEFPMLCLLVSGGHTLIILVNGVDDMRVIGKTRDDAAGEAYDKSAKMLGLPYPGGPMMEKNAVGGNAGAYPFPKPEVPDLDFSFSGLKTSIKYFLQKNIQTNPSFISENMRDICASVQWSINSYLLFKLEKALTQFECKTIAIVGGVSANKNLREMIVSLSKKYDKNWIIPSFEYCTDNAGMIAMSAHHLYSKGRFMQLDDVPFTSGEFQFGKVVT